VRKKPAAHRPVAHGPILRGAMAIEFLAFQKTYVEKCLQKSLSRAIMTKKDANQEAAESSSLGKTES
jgi:hypothetical protein